MHCSWTRDAFAQAMASCMLIIHPWLPQAPQLPASMLFQSTMLAYPPPGNRMLVTPMDDTACVYPVLLASAVES
jgi:hypothetical protein